MSSCIKLAVVDDHLLFRKGLIAQLRDFPQFEVLMEASNGRELLDAISHTPIDVVLLDLQMPVMNGAEVAEHLQHKCPGTKIIIVSMHDSESYIHQLIGKGVSGFVLKDQGIEAVADAIHGVMENNYYFNERVSQAMVRGLIDSKMISPVFNSVQLTEREIEIIRLISCELTNREIAKKLSLSVRTIDGHKERILSKTKAKNVIGVIMYAHKHKLL